MKQFVLMIILGAGTQAQAAIPVEQALELCRAEQNALRRLNCYDAISADTTASPVPVAPPTQQTAVSQQALNQHQVLTQQEPADTAESRFGLEHKESKSDTADKLYVTVKKVSENNLKKLVLEFTNGQVWRQTDSGLYQVKNGEKHYIKRGMLDSFFLGNDDNNRTIRVKREQ